LGGFAIGAQVALLWQDNANPSYNLASIPRYDDHNQNGILIGSAIFAGLTSVTGRQTMLLGR